MCPVTGNHFKMKFVWRIRKIASHLTFFRYLVFQVRVGAFALPSSPSPPLPKKKTPMLHTFTHTHTYAHTHTYTHTNTHLVVCLQVVNLFVEGVDPELLTNEHDRIEFILESRLVSRHSLDHTFTDSMS